MKRSPDTQPVEKRPLPKGWRWARLGEVCEVIAGQSPPGDTYRKTAEGLPFFQGKADFGPRHPVARTWCVAPKKVALPGDILMSVRAPVGPTNVANVKCCIGRGLAAIRCASQCDADFVLAALRLFEGDLANLGSGSTFSAIKRDDLESLRIPLPPLPEQKRIAAILEEQLAAVNKARAAAEERLEGVRALPAAFLRQVFPQPGAPLPKGWRWVRLREVCEVNPRRPAGFARPNSKPTTFVPMSAVDDRQGIIARPETRPYAQVRKGYTYFAEGDVLFAKITPCMQNGKHAVAHALIDGVGFASTEFHVLRPQADITSDWVHNFVRQPWVLDAATAHFTGAVGQQRVPGGYLADLEIPLPPLAEQKRIAAFLKEHLATVDKARATAEEELATVNALPAALLRRAFSGEL